jgi:hypothetical protein
MYLCEATGKWMLTRKEGQAVVDSLAAYSPPAPELAAELEAMPTLRRIALMQMHESHVSRTVTKRLMEDVQLTAGAADYAALRDRGFCERRPADRWHNLTWAGREAASHLERLLCKRFGIHLMMEVGTGKYDVHFRCPCGEWDFRSAKGDYTVANARHSYHKHVATADGMMKLFVALRAPAKMESA